MDEHFDDLALLLFFEVETSHVLEGLHVILRRHDRLEDCLLDICVHMLLTSYIHNFRHILLLFLLVHH